MANKSPGLTCKASSSGKGRPRSRSRSRSLQTTPLWVRVVTRQLASASGQIPMAAAANHHRAQADAARQRRADFEEALRLNDGAYTGELLQRDCFFVKEYGLTYRV